MSDQSNSDQNSWRSSTSLQVLKQRALLNQHIRDFFKMRDVLEVETPILSRYATSDSAIESFSCLVKNHSSVSSTRYLHTSPEFAMKRLLASGSGSIYQLCKVFRQEEQGRWHNPEFTMLEWYRVGMDYQSLIDEVDELLPVLLASLKPLKSSIRLSYRELFEQYLGVNPHTTDRQQLIGLMAQHKIDLYDKSDEYDDDTCLQLLLTHVIEPAMPRQCLVYLYDYPASQASLARLKAVDDYWVAQRFECYLNGVELANGFQELTDAHEQQQRFEQDNQIRVESGLTAVPYDQHLLRAMQHGLPECSGVAVGLDRVLLLSLSLDSVSSVLSFDFERA